MTKKHTLITIFDLKIPHPFSKLILTEMSELIFLVIPFTDSYDMMANKFPPSGSNVKLNSFAAYHRPSHIINQSIHHIFRPPPIDTLLVFIKKQSDAKQRRSMLAVNLTRERQM